MHICIYIYMHARTFHAFCIHAWFIYAAIHTYIRARACVRGWTDGRMDAWMTGMDKWMGECMGGWMDVKIWMDGWMDGWVAGWLAGWREYMDW